MNFEINPIKMTKLEWPRQQTSIGGGRFVGHLGYRMSDQPIFELEWKVDGSNSYMKFGRNPIKNDWVRVTTTADIDRWRPFCRPSWLSDVGQNPYSNLNERLMEAIHIWNLEEIWLKMTELGWPQTDRWTDGQTDGQAENNRAPPTFVGGALMNIFILSLNVFLLFKGKLVNSPVEQSNSNC